MRVCKEGGWWAEHLNLMDENQWGFRSGKSTADVTSDCENERGCG